MIEVPGDPPKRYDEDVLRLVLAEAQRVRGNAVAVGDGMRQRAALLAGTSSIAGALTATVDNPWTWLGAGLFAIAALAGIAVFWPSTGRTVRPDALLNRAANYSAPQVLYMYIRSTTKETLSLRRGIRRNGWISRVGLVALVAGVILTVALATIQMEGGGQDREAATSAERG